MNLYTHCRCIQIKGNYFRFMRMGGIPVMTPQHFLQTNKIMSLRCTVCVMDLLSARQEFFFVMGAFRHKFSILIRRIFYLMEDMLIVGESSSVLI